MSNVMLKLRLLTVALLITPSAQAAQGTIVGPTAGPKTMTEVMTTLNAALLAIQSCNSGSSAPANGIGGLATTYQCWADTSASPVISYKTYDGTQWVTFGTLNTSTHVWTPYRAGAAIAAVATSSSAGDLTNGTLPAARLPAPTASSFGGVQSLTCSASNWFRTLATSGVFGCSQPAFSDLTGSVAATQMPALSGDVSTTAGATVTTIGPNKVVDSMLRAGGALTVIGRATNTGGNVADIAAVAGSSCAYRESANTISCGQLATAAYAAGSVTNAKLAPMANGTVKCRTTAGSGDPEDCTAAQTRSLLSVVVGTNVQAWDADLDCVAALSTTGLIRRTGAGTCSAGTVVAASEGGFGSDISAQSGAPLFSAGVPTFISTTGTGNFARAVSPSFTTPSLGAATATSVVASVSLEANGANPQIISHFSSGGTDQKRWDFQAGNLILEGRAINDAANAAVSWLIVNRGAGTAISNVQFPQGAVNFGSPAATKPGVISLYGSSSGSTGIQPQIAASGLLTLPAATDTLVGRATTDTLTNKDVTSGTNTFPTFNQNTTGSAAKLTTPRNIDGQAFDGTAAITVIAPGTHAAPGKTTPVDADEVPLVDSASSNTLARLTWANLKATLKTYFDALTTTLSNKTLASPALTGTVTGTNNIPNGVLAQAGAATIKGNPTGSTANVTDFTIQGLTARGAPDASNDKIPVYDNAAGTIKYVTPAQVAAAATAGVSSIGGQTGAITLGPGLSISGSVLSGGREALVANRTYYFRSDGSDSNTGLANTSGGAFLTANKAFQVITGSLDFSGYTVTVQRGDAVDMTTQIAVNPWLGGGNLVLDLNARTLNTTSADAILCSGTWTGNLTVQNGILRTTTSGTALNNSAVGLINIGAGVTFGATAGPHMQAANAGAQISATSNYTISGGATIHWSSLHGAFVQTNFRTITLTGTPAFSVAFAYASDRSGIEAASTTFSGSATGVRYNSIGVSFINVFGAGANYLPGNSAGATATGGQYN